MDNKIMETIPDDDKSIILYVYAIKFIRCEQRNSEKQAKFLQGNT